MRRRTSLFLAGILLIVSAGCSGTGRQTRPSAKLIGIRFGELDRAALEVVFDIEIKNPYSVDMPLTSMTYRLCCKKCEFAAGSANPNTTIPAGTKQKISLPVRVHYGHILRTLEDVEPIKGIEPGSKIPYKAELTISVDTQTLGEIEMPLKKSGKATLPYISGVTYKRVLEMIKYE